LAGACTQVVAPAGSTIWQTVPVVVQDVLDSGSQPLLGMQRYAPVGAAAAPTCTSSGLTQCSPLGHPVQSIPQQSLRHTPPTHSDPAAQSVHCEHGLPKAVVPAGSHMGEMAASGAKLGTQLEALPHVFV
jgi:hypothetical protein